MRNINEHDDRRTSTAISGEPVSEVVGLVSLGDAVERTQGSGQSTNENKREFYN